MPGAKFLGYKDKRILVIDLGNCDLENMVKIVKEAKVLIAKEPPQSVLTLTNVQGIKFHGLISKVAKEFTEHNKPFVKAAAIIGLDPVRVDDFKEIVDFARREFKVFESSEEAKDWLITQ